MRNALLIAFLSLGLVGCFLGDSVAVRTVSLNFPTQASESRVILVATDPQVQEALKLVDEIMVAHGYHDYPPSISAADKSRGIVAFYGICGVSFRDNKLDIGFVENHRLHSTATVKNLCKVLKEKLSSRYGAKNVK